MSLRLVRSLVALFALFTVAACASGPTASVEMADRPFVGIPGDLSSSRDPVQTAGRQPVPGTAEHFQANATDRVYFDFDRFALRADARATLDRQAQWLIAYPQTRIRIEGHADERGTREYNLALGARRAMSVRDYLISRGVNASRIQTISFGKERPIDPRSNEEAWARNRNAHTVILEGPGA